MNIRWGTKIITELMRSLGMGLSSRAIQFRSSRIPFCAFVHGKSGSFFPHTTTDLIRLMFSGFLTAPPFPLKSSLRPISRGLFLFLSLAHLRFFFSRVPV